MSSNEYSEELKLNIRCDEDDSHAAVLYCTRCETSLCKTCSDVIHAMRSLSSHRVVRLTQKPEPPICCYSHQQETSELACKIPIDSPSSSCPDWNNLPNEIKLKIIQNADNNSRLALKACSWNDHELVASISFRTIHKMYLWNERGKRWHINITRNMYGSESFLIFDTFEQFQKKLEEEIENSDFIESLELAQKRTSNQLKLKKSGKLLKVRELIFSTCKQEALDILGQIDPFHLKTLKLHQIGVHSDVFETPQVKNVYYLQVQQNHITDDQLLNMKNPELFLYGKANMTVTGINHYIKKCLFNLDIKPVFFRIEFRQATENIEKLFRGVEFRRIISSELWCDESSELWCDERESFRVGSNLSNHQLEIKFWHYYIEGRTICKNQHPESHRDPHPSNPLKSVDCVTIEDGRFTIAGRNTAPITHIFDSNDGLQKKLTEEMNKINYIKHLELKQTEVNWQLCPLNKQVTVGKLLVRGRSLNTKLLRQLEPIHLKEIIISVESNDGKMYKTPQLIHAQKLKLSNSWIQEEDLIRMNAIQIIIDSGRSTTLTNSGINKFIKKILTNLKTQDYNFQIRHSRDEESASERLKGLDIFSSERVGCFDTRIIVNSPFSEFKLELLVRRREIKGKRITAEDAEKPYQVYVMEDYEFDDDDDDDEDNDDDLY